MARYTGQQVRDMVAELAAKEVVFKVEVDTIKYHVSSAYDADKNKVREEFTYAGRWQKLTEAEQALDLPYSLVHLYGKKFAKTLEAAGDTAFTAAIRALRSDWEETNLHMIDLGARAVKGRRPVESNRVVIGTRVQYRAICPCCFNDQAIVNGGMADHGFQVQWNSRQGRCFGTGRAHFGTEEGKAVAQYLMEAELETAAASKLAAQMLRDGSALPRRNGKVIENPTQMQINAAIRDQEFNERQAESNANFYTRKLDKWEPVEPFPVTVEVYE